LGEGDEVAGGDFDDTKGWELVRRAMLPSAVSRAPRGNRGRARGSSRGTHVGHGSIRRASVKEWRKVRPMPRLGLPHARSVAGGVYTGPAAEGVGW
jgi:hypothetical protein